MLISSRSAAECEAVKSGRPGKASPGRSLLCHLGRTGLYLNFHICACVQSCFSCAQLFVTLWTVARQAPLSMGFSRQEYRNELPCPLPGDLPDPGLEPASLKSPALAGSFFTTSATWEALPYCNMRIIMPISKSSWVSDKVRDIVGAYKCPPLSLSLF